MLGSAVSGHSVDDFANFCSQMDTECDVDRSAGRGFNLSALYAVLPLVGQIRNVEEIISQRKFDFSHIP